MDSVGIVIIVLAVCAALAWYRLKHVYIYDPFENKQAILTIDQLKAVGVCESEIDKFRQLFGDYVIVTKQQVRAVADKFEWNQAAGLLLSEPAFQWYVSRKQQLESDVYRLFPSGSPQISTLKSGTLWAAYLETLAMLFAYAYIKDQKEGWETYE